MKRTELTQLTQIIEHLVRREVRKQLPGIIAETLKKTSNKTQQPIVEQAVVENSSPDSDNFKMSMRELFAGVTPVTARAEVNGQPVSQTQQPRHFTNNPVINQILNETTSDLRQRERMVGGAAMMGGYSPSVALAAGSMMAGAGEMIPESEMPSFSKNMPTMPQAVNPRQTIVNQPRITVEQIPEGVSALDVARQVPLAQPVAQALTKNYSAMMKLIDNKRKGKIS